MLQGTTMMKTKVKYMQRNTNKYDVWCHKPVQQTCQVWFNQNIDNE